MLPAHISDDDREEFERVLLGPRIHPGNELATLPAASPPADRSGNCDSTYEALARELAASL